MKTLKHSIPFILCALFFVVPSTFALTQDQCPNLTTTSTVPTDWTLVYGTPTGNNKFSNVVISLSNLVGCFYNSDNSIMLQKITGFEIQLMYKENWSKLISGGYICNTSIEGCAYKY